MSYELHLGSNYFSKSSECTLALLPAGGELWEDFLDTIGVSLEQFCSEGPGGWMLGYMDALQSVNIRTVVILFSAKIVEPLRYVSKHNRNVITVLPVRNIYRRLRPLGQTYQQARLGGPLHGCKDMIRRCAGSVLSHISTPVIALRQELLHHNCSVILVQEYEYFRFDLSIVLGAQLNIPVFATFQGSTSESNYLSRLWKAYLIRRAGGLLIAAGQEAERVRQRYGFHVKISRVFNPVNVKEWGQEEREQERATLKASAQTRIVVWHGRIAIFSKGLDVLLEAWQRVAQERRGQDLRLMIMGTGEDADEFGRLLAALPDSNVSWINRYVTDRSMIRRFLAAGDVFAFPSRLEGFPVAPIEAMACGVPVVAASASGMSDILNSDASGGLVVPVGDPDTFACALGRMIDNPSLRRVCGEQARRRIESAFSLETVGRQLKSVMFNGKADGAAQ